MIIFEMRFGSVMNSVMKNKETCICDAECILTDITRIRAATVSLTNYIRIYRTLAYDETQIHGINLPIFVNPSAHDTVTEAL